MVVVRDAFETLMECYAMLLRFATCATLFDRLATANVLSPGPPA